MPPVVDTEQLELMKELLRQRGLLATGGNIRSLPFASSNGVPPGGVNGSNGSSSVANGIPSDAAATVPPT